MTKLNYVENYLMKYVGRELNINASQINAVAVRVVGFQCNVNNVSRVKTCKIR